MFCPSLQRRLPLRQELLPLVHSHHAADGPQNLVQQLVSHMQHHVVACYPSDGHAPKVVYSPAAQERRVVKAAAAAALAM